MSLPRQLELLDASIDTALASGRHLRASHVHKAFTISGLPHKKLNKPSDSFLRKADGLSLSVTPLPFSLDAYEGGRQQFVGVPYGSKARLALIWLSTQVKSRDRTPGNREIEIPIIREWVASMGLSINGYTLNQLKEQILRLTMSHFLLTYEDSDMNSFNILNTEGIVEGATFAQDDVKHFLEGHPEKMRWPAAITLTQQAYDGFLRDSVPVPTEILVNLSNSSMAIDLLMFLCYRLPQVPEGMKEFIEWGDVISYFGSGETVGRFKNRYGAAIKAAVNAFDSEAVKITDMGLVLNHRDPERLVEAFYVTGPRQKKSRTRNRRSRINPEEAVVIGTK